MKKNDNPKNKAAKNVNTESAAVLPLNKRIGSKGLGKGLSALLSPTQEIKQKAEKIEDMVIMVKINAIKPNEGQPRKDFDEEKLAELAQSIKENGIIQPLLVTKGEKSNTYQIVAGERRWRAARIAGKEEVPVILRELTAEEILRHALIENIQREDLNPLEEALSLKQLLNEYKMTQENLALSVGKSRSAITNILRLLKLPVEIQEMLATGKLTAGHARALLALPEDFQEKTAQHIIDQQLSVRETEELVAEMLQPKSEKVEHKATRSYEYESNIRALENKLSHLFSTKVKVKGKAEKGSIIIEYYSAEDLERILEQIK